MLYFVYTNPSPLLSLVSSIKMCSYKALIFIFDDKSVNNRVYFTTMLTIWLIFQPFPGTRPECQPNIDLDHVLVENDCRIDPDRIELTCSVEYNGNRPPTLEWRHSSSPQILPSNSHSGSTGPARSILIVQPDMSLNGSHYACSVKDLITCEGGCGCVTKNISVMCKCFSFDWTIFINHGNTQV